MGEHTKKDNPGCPWEGRQVVMGGQGQKGHALHTFLCPLKFLP